MTRQADTYGPLQVLVRTPRYAVVAKPARLACHRSDMVRDRVTLITLARRRFGMQVHLVHRLDRGVSGCLLVAFDTETTSMLQEALSSPEARKSYVALVRGYFRWDDPVVVDTDVSTSSKDPRPARSVVHLLGRSHVPRCSLLEVHPETGRFHQVRRHLRDLGHPILGDAQHGDSRENKAWRETRGLRRLALHCRSLTVPLPDGTVLDTWCPPPADLVDLVRPLPLWAQATARSAWLARPAMDLDHEGAQAPVERG